MSEEVVEVESEEIAGSSLGGEAIDQQIATAKQYPRSVDSCMKEAKTLATKNEDVAASCFYSLPRGGNTIKGPSIRLAEIMLYSWGNLRADSQIVEESHEEIVAQASAVDLEKNIAVRKQATQSIIKSNGDRYSGDMIKNTKNAAMSIALRNAVFSVIPQTYVDEIFKKAQKASIGEGKTMDERRESCLEYFSEQDVSPRQVFDLLGVNGKEDIDEENLIDLRGLVTAIEDNQYTVDEVFGDTESDAEHTLNKYVQDSGESEAEDDTDDSASEDQKTEETPDEEQSALAEEVDELREELAEVREGGISEEDIDTPDTDEEQDADDDEQTTDHDEPATKQVVK